MGWVEIEKKHHDQRLKFEEMKTTSWSQLQQRNQEIREAFGNKDLPDYILKREEQAISQWLKAWGEDGSKTKLILQIQKMEIDRLTRIRTQEKNNSVSKNIKSDWGRQR